MSNRYSIKGKIGQGGLGAVYKAFDNNLGREVALKRVLPAEGEDPKEMAQNLIKEAKTLSALQHPHIVTVYDVGEDAEGPYVVMELLKGETLDTTIKRGALPADDFKQVVIQSLEALVAAQALGITHRDLKPANIMVIWLPSGKFQIKILDFGLAKFSHQPSVQTIDQSDSILGSIYFMAPEQFERLPLDSRTDLYSIAAIYYYTLTGQYPFQGDTAPQVMAAHLQHRYKSLAALRPDIPAFIPNWVSWLMARKADDRPADASEALRYFHQEKVGGPAAAIPTARPATGATSGKLVTGTGAKSARLVSKAATSTGTRSGKLVANSPTPAPGAVVADPVPLDDSAEVILVEEGHIQPPSGPGFFGRIPKWALITAPTMLIGVACIAVYLYLQNARAEERNERFTEIIARGIAPGTPEDIKLLATFLKDMEDGRSAEAASAMARLEGEGINGTMLGLLKKFDRTALVNLLAAIGLRRNPESFDAVLSYATSKNAEVRKEAFNTLGFVGTRSDLPKLIQMLDTVSSDVDREFLENAILNIARTNPDLEDRTNPLISVMGTADKEKKLSLIAILGTLGGSDALKTITNALGSSDTDVRLGAAKAFENWPNGAPLKALVNFVKTEEDPAVKIIAYRTIGQLSQLPGPLAESEVQKLLEDVLGATTHKRSQDVIRNAIAVLADDSAIAFFRTLENDPAHKDLAKSAIENINKLKKDVVDLGPGGALTPDKAALKPQDSVVQSGILKEWAYVENRIIWRFAISEGGTFRISANQASKSENPGSYSVHLGDKILLQKVQNTGGDFRSVPVGEVELSSPGIYKVWIQPVTVDDDDKLMDLRELKIEPK